MSLEETKALISLLKDSGVTYFKNQEMELRLELQPAQINPMIPLDAPTPIPEEIKHKTEELSSLLKLSDAELVDRLFPDHREQEEESA